MAASRPTIVRGGRIACRRPDGGRSYLRVKGLLQYIAFGHRLERPARGLRQRGEWLDAAARERDHADVLRWAKAKVHRFGYPVSYQLLLSGRSGGMTAADFATALRAGSAISGVCDWRLMIHEDTANQHAHVVLFRQQPLTRAQYRQWQQTMQATLDRQQLARERALELVAEQSHAAELRSVPQTLELTL